MNQPFNQPVIVRCRCGQQFRARADLAGKRVKCPTCGAPIDVPLPSTATQPAIPPTNDTWDDLGALESASAPLASGGQRLPVTGYRAPRAKQSVPSWLLPVGLAVGGILVVSLLVVFVVSFVSGLTSAARKAGDDQIASWKTFRHPGGEFSIAMPGHVDTSDASRSDGFCSRMLDAHSRSSDGTLVSAILYVDVVPSASGIPQYERYGEGVWGSHPNVVSSRIEMFGRPGLEYKGTLQEDGEPQWICSRVILLDDRLYELSLQRKSGEPMAASQVETFFATFQPSELSE